MSKPLRIIMVEDSEDDALLTIRALKKGGYEPVYERVETAEAMRKALRKKTWDVILCDYKMPQFNGLAAIALLKETGVDIPIIIVSGAIGEETAVECMRSGAQDYVMKGNLSRLVSAIERELKEAESRTQRIRAEEALEESETKYDELAHFLPQIVFETDMKGNITFVNHAAHSISGYSPEEFNRGLNVLQLLVPEEWDRARFNIQGLLHGKKLQGNEFTFLRKDGRTFPVITNAIPIVRNNQIVGLRGLVIDITERKMAEDRLKKTLESLRKALGTTIQVMVSAVETRDPYTAGHQSRSADLARAIAIEMELPREKIEAIRMAGSIHDIGKLSIPAEILSKPTKLTNLEFSLIKEHSRQGYEMLKDVESPWPLAEIVYQHHERMDGTGYPRNLKGEDILMEARIMAVADVVESMASHRPYRPAIGVKAALEEIEKNKGILYDNAVADACLRLFRDKGFQLEKV
jgi:PAS domain S-box-containing protein